MVLNHLQKATPLHARALHEAQNKNGALLWLQKLRRFQTHSDLNVVKLSVPELNCTDNLFIGIVYSVVRYCNTTLTCTNDDFTVLLCTE